MYGRHPVFPATYKPNIAMGYERDTPNMPGIYLLKLYSYTVLNLLTLSILLISHAPHLAAVPVSSDSSKPRIYVIGVVHTETKYRNADSLLIILKDIRPDLILSEMDTVSGYFRPDYSLVKPPGWYKAARKLRLARKMGPEFEVLYSYLKQDPTVRIHPYDIDIPNRKNYTREEHDWIEALEKAYDQGELPAELDSTYKDYIKLFELYYHMNGLSYSQLNRRTLSDSMRNNLMMEERLSKKLVQEAAVLAPYRDWQTLHFMNWNHRNQVMADNIIRFIEKTGAKKVVVFTGLLHKYSLTDTLGSGDNRQRYTLEEYFDGRR
jgi:hypothetical protein